MSIYQPSNEHIMEHKEKTLQVKVKHYWQIMAFCIIRHLLGLIQTRNLSSNLSYHKYMYFNKEKKIIQSARHGMIAWRPTVRFSTNNLFFAVTTVRLKSNLTSCNWNCFCTCISRFSKSKLKRDMFIGQYTFFSYIYHEIQTVTSQH